MKHLKGIRRRRGTRRKKENNPINGKKSLFAAHAKDMSKPLIFQSETEPTATE